jgi:uncharacterized damage-inducible protein DinB
MDKMQALKRLTKSRRALLSSIENLSDKDMTQYPVEGLWSIKDLLAHITSWERVTLGPLRIYSKSGDFDPELILDHDAWNEAEAKRWQAKSLADIQEEIQQIRQELTNLADEVSIDRWQVRIPAPWGGQGTLAELLAGLAWHEEEHTKTIRRWLRARESY